jgi:hypothetical protein
MSEDQYSQSFKVVWSNKTLYLYGNSGDCVGTPQLIATPLTCVDELGADDNFEVFGIPASTLWLETNITTGNSNAHNSVSAGIVAGITVGVIIFVATVSLAVFYFFFKKTAPALSKQEISIGVIPTSVSK